MSKESDGAKKVARWLLTNPYRLRALQALVGALLFSFGSALVVMSIYPKLMAGVGVFLTLFGLTLIGTLTRDRGGRGRGDRGRSRP